MRNNIGDCEEGDNRRAAVRFQLLKAVSKTQIASPLTLRQRRINLRLSLRVRLNPNESVSGGQIPNRVRNDGWLRRQPKKKHRHPELLSGSDLIRRPRAQEGRIRNPENNSGQASSA